MYSINTFITIMCYVTMCLAKVYKIEKPAQESQICWKLLCNFFSFAGGFLPTNGRMLLRAANLPAFIDMIEATGTRDSRKCQVVSF